MTPPWTVRDTLAEWMYEETIRGEWMVNNATDIGAPPKWSEAHDVDRGIAYERADAVLLIIAEEGKL